MIFLDYVKAIFTSKKCKDCIKFSKNQYDTFCRQNNYGFCEVSKKVFYATDGNKRPCILFRNKNK